VFASLPLLAPGLQSVHSRRKDHDAIRLQEILWQLDVQRRGKRCKDLGHPRGPLVLTGDEIAHPKGLEVYHGSVELVGEHDPIPDNLIQRSGYEESSSVG
jgi:hypothetical protein